MAFDVSYVSVTTSTTPPSDTLSVVYLTTSAQDDGIPTIQKSILVGTLLSALALSAIIGNLLVIFSVCLDRHLHSPPNILIVNLAVADLLVGLLVMPFAIAQSVGRPWIWTDFICDVYVSSDVLSCTASIVTLCMISVDRYLAITRPFRYAPKRTPRLMLFMVLIVWIIGAAISISPHIWGGNEHSGHLCLLSQNIVFTIYSTFGAFYLPLIIMLSVYYKIYRAAKRSEEAERHRRPSILPNSRRSSHVSENSQNEDFNVRRKSLVRFADYLKNKARPSIVSIKAGNGIRRISLRGERKAAKTLGVIMGAFILCWLPFFLVAVIRPFFPWEIPLLFDNILLWLGYTNSAINPVIYTIYNKAFGPAYKRILKCQCIMDSEYMKRRKPLYTKRSTGTSRGVQSGVRLQDVKRDYESDEKYDYMDLTSTDLLNGNVVNRRLSEICALDKISEESEMSASPV